MSRRAEVEAPPEVHQGVNAGPHLADWSSWHSSKANPKLCPAGHEIRSCGVYGCGRHQVRSTKED
jgi:hypothetical protein